jgi:hypothetical protein
VRRARRLFIRRAVIAAGVGGFLVIGVALPLALLFPLGGSAKRQQGDSPSPSVVSPSPSPSAPAPLTQGTAQLDGEDGIFVLTPPSWFFAALPSGPAEPKVLFAIADFPVKPGGECAPTRALEDLPVDGALAWALEYHDTQGNDFPPRPERFSLDQFSLANYECSAGHATYMFRFQDAGRYFQVHVAFGDEARDEVRDEILASLSTLVVDRCPPADSPVLVSEFGTLVPDLGAPGDTIGFSGSTGHDENWFWAPLDKIDVWWSSDFVGVPAETADKYLLASIDPLQDCDFSVSFQVPDVPPGHYFVTVLGYDSSGFGLMGERRFTVAS